MRRAWRRSEKMIDFTRCRNAQVVERMTEDDYLQKQGFEVRGKAEYFMYRNFAHRGLHDMDRSIPENSLMAFAAALCLVLPGCSASEIQKTESAAEKPFEFTLWNEGAPALTAAPPADRTLC